MKEYQTRKKQIEIRECTYVVSITCDLCQKNFTPNWSTGYYGVAETDIRYKEGSNYPEGGNGTETTIDICPECFTQKLIPWVIEQGGKPTVTEWDW